MKRWTPLLFQSVFGAEIMVAETITAGCFLEDIGQERFIRALVLRVAAEAGCETGQIRFDVRSASGGGGVAIAGFRQFLRDCGAGQQSSFDILVAAIDGNCKGATEVTNRLSEFAARAGYAGAIVYAIPDPHIEKWYMADLSACQQVLGTAQQPKCPPLKCEKDLYKRALIDAIKTTGVIPLQGGSEYAAEIAQQMNLYEAGKNDASLGRFLSDMKTALLAVCL